MLAKYSRVSPQRRRKESQKYYILYQEEQAVARVAGETWKRFEVPKRVRQGCMFFPYKYNIYIENVMIQVKHDETTKR